MVWINSENKLSFYGRQSDTKGFSIDSIYTIPSDVFTHVAVSVDGDGSDARLYINGRLDQQARLDQPIDSLGQDFKIGRGLYGATTKLADLKSQQRPPVGTDPAVMQGYYDENFSGIIKEVRVWQTARSQGAIVKSRYQRFEGREPDLVGYWPLTQIGENELPDWAHGNNGKLGGDQFVTQPQWVQRDLILDPLPEQGDGTGYQFNGIDQYLAADGVRYAPIDSLTLEAWVTIADGSHNNCVICYGNAATPQIDFQLHHQRSFYRPSQE